MFYIFVNINLYIIFRLAMLALIANVTDMLSACIAAVALRLRAVHGPFRIMKLLVFLFEIVKNYVKNV